ncbi:MAG: M23 family metallopeptidase [Saprospiraceae bacterium]|nr:M23 family metallopeptidase [Saprospiraceae bacterium]
MKKEKFVYNPKSLTFEKYRASTSQKFVKASGFIVVIGLVAAAMVYAIFEFLPSPKEQALMREVEQMKIKYASVDEQLNVMSKVLNNIQDRDANVHRMVFGMDPINEDVWNSGVGGHAQYGELTPYKNSGDLLIQTLEKADKLRRQMAVQSRSLDSLEAVAGEKEKFLSSVPSIKPVRSDLLKRNIRHLSGYGMRIHPVHKIPKMHYGLDFTAPRGTSVRVSGDGKVVRVRKDRSGYGHNITVDHGFGYKTLYAHLQDMGVREGQKVSKGQEIGTVGNTGTSTAPHLHYEVRYKGSPVDPIHYCMDGLTPDQYEEMVKMASEANKSFD